MTHFNEEAFANAKQAKSVEEQLTRAKESGVEMTAGQAQEYYTQLNLKSGELADDELDNVAGGVGNNGGVYPIFSPVYSCDLWTCADCGNTDCRCSPTRRALCIDCKYVGPFDAVVSNSGYMMCHNPSNSVKLPVIDDFKNKTNDGIL